MSAFANFFRSNQPQNQPQPNPNPNPNPADPNAVKNPANPLNPDPNANPDPNKPINDPNANRSPLDEFSKLFDNKQSSNNPQQGIFGPALDPKKLMEAVSTMNFTGGISQQTMEDIKAGGDKASAAVVDAMNQTARLVYAQTANLIRNVVESAAGKLEGRLSESLPEKLRLHNLQDSTLESNPAFSHPAVKPLVTVLTQQFAESYPDKSPKELNGMVLKYISEMSGLVANKEDGTGNGPRDRRNSGKGSTSMDFSNFLTGDN